MPIEEESKAASAAEEKKELGNAAFASGKFAEAVTHYTDAIRLDPTNHIYYSNRSVSYASLSKWAEAKADATECLRLNPSFLKAYYRLATAQIELNELDGAHATVKQGLALDPDNSQLQKQLRIVNGKKKDARRGSSSARSRTADDSSNAIVASAAAGSSGGAAADSSIGHEIMDLRGQLAATTREYNITRANISRSDKERQISELTRTELGRLPATSDSKMYRGIGKMFLLSSRENVMDHLESTIADEGKRAKDLSAKLEYLEKRMKSQRQNIDELMRGARGDGGGGGAITSSV